MSEELQVEDVTALHWPLAQDSRRVDWNERSAFDDRESDDDGATYGYWEAVNVADKDGEGELWVIVRSGEVTHVHIGDGDPDYGPLLPIHDVEEWSWAVDVSDAETERREEIHSRVQLFADRASEYSEGPMMNYAYPVIDDTDDDDRNAEWAYAIRRLPLCVVELDGYTGLALTGGGMDLSWEIAEAFLRIGYRPPIDVCDSPPADAHRMTGTRRIIVAVLVDTLRRLAEGYAFRAERLAELTKS